MSDTTEFSLIREQIQPCFRFHKEEALVNFFDMCFDDVASRLIHSSKDTKEKGRKLTKYVFANFMNLPIIACDNIFRVFDSAFSEGSLSKFDFVRGMYDLYFGSLQHLMYMTFKFFDICDKNLIFKEDVKLILKYLVKASSADNSNSEEIQFLENIEEYISNFFESQYMTFKEYSKKIKNSDSNIFFIFLILIYRKQNFNESSLEYFIKCMNKLKEDEEEKINSIINKRNKIKKTTNCSSQSNSSAKDSLTISNTTLAHSENEEDDTICLPGKEILNFIHQNNFQNNNPYPHPQPYEEIVYKLCNNKLIRTKIHILSNHIFSHRYSHSKDKYILESIHFLSGYLPTSCEETTLGNYKLFAFALITQYGNCLANVENIFFLKNKDHMYKCFLHLKSAMQVRDIEDYYEVIKQIGKGHFSQVLLGIGKKSHMQVAVKVITKSKMNQKELKLAQNEIDIMKYLMKVTHPNVIKVYDVFEDKHNVFIVMENVSGGNLEILRKSQCDFLKEDGYVKSLVKQLAEGLNFINKSGIIHRDLKNENILVNINSQSNLSNSLMTPCLKIIDFGLSKVMSQNETTSEGFGTFLFSAPEVLSGKSYGFKIDVWSFGVIVYNLLWGVFPFDVKDNDMKTLVTKICKEELIIDNNFIKSQEIIDLVKNCLIKNPSERYCIGNVLSSKWMD